MNEDNQNQKKSWKTPQVEILLIDETAQLLPPEPGNQDDPPVS